MKKIILYSLVFLITLFYSGCSKNLVEEPLSLLSPANFYNSNGDFDQAINGALRGAWSGYYQTAVQYVMSAGGDDISSKADAPQAKIFDNFLAAPNNNYTQTTWTTFYRIINMCNPIISNVGHATEVNESKKKIYEGQGSVRRALSLGGCRRWVGGVAGLVSGGGKCRGGV
jgi:hypothetical protein